MKVDITFDNKFLILGSDYPFELNILRKELTRELSDAWILKKTKPYLNTERCFMNEYGMIPIGLWLELMSLSKKYNIFLDLTDNAAQYLNQFFLDFNLFKQYIDIMFKDAEMPLKDQPGKFVPFKPRDYQVKAAYSLLKYRKCCGEISTSGGKTLISFIIFKYLIDIFPKNKILYIVPSVDLATQSAEKYEEYESYLKKHKHNWSIGILKSGLTKKQKEAVESCNILFGTYQSLCKRSNEFFDVFTSTIVDECLEPDALILMADNTYKRIADIQINDKVITLNTNTQIQEIHEVEYVYKGISVNEDLYQIFYDDKCLKITGNHKVLLNDNKWVRVDQLNIGNTLILNDKTVNVCNIIKIGKATDNVYNLRIKSQDEYNHNYFANNLCVSNCHHMISNSMKKIIDKCQYLQYAIAVTGTFPKHDTCDNLTIQSYIGPVVYTLSADELINEEKSATPIYAVFQIMDWCSDEEKLQLHMMRCQKSNPDNQGDFKLGTKLLKQEMQFINNSYTRLKYIADMAIKTAKNTLILFGDIKGGYGKKLQEYIKDNSDKNVYYVDGSTDETNRKYYKDMCEQDTEGKTILVASIGTFGEGIDLCNIWTIFLVNSAKSERLVRQICGRGLRKYPGKDKTVLFDFVDDLRYSIQMNNKYYDNYMWKHYKERKKIYQEQNFPVYEQKIAFTKKTLNIL